MALSLVLDAVRQCFFIPQPPLTAANLPDQSGRVFIVTGGYAGVGKQLSSILYQRNGTVYIAGRSQAKADAAISEIKQSNPSSDGRLEFLQLDLADLTTIQASANDFLRREQRLDVLTNNAGVMTPPPGAKTEQGYELQAGTNILGPWLFTELLTPILKKTAASSPTASVRVTWAASLVTVAAPPGGVSFTPEGSPAVHSLSVFNYAQSKASNVLLAQEYQARHGASGIVSNSWNPGNLSSELVRHRGNFEANMLRWTLLYEPVYGAYTELFAGWSQEAGEAKNRGKYIVPWGRFGVLRSDVEGGAKASKLWEWCERESKPYINLLATLSSPVPWI